MRRSIGLTATLIAFVGASFVGSARPASAVTGPEVDIASASVQEGDAGSMIVQVPITLSAPAATTVKVVVAVPGKSVTVTFLPGVVQRPANVTIAGDTVVEPDQQVPVTLTALKTQNAVLGMRNGRVTVVDDDANGVPSAPEAAVGGVAMVEGDATARTALVPVTLSAPATATTKVQFTTNCGGLSPNDYTPVNAVVSFAKGQRIKMVAVATKPDLMQEHDESVGDSSTKNGTTTTSQLMIIDDDAPGVPVDPTPPVIGIQRVSEVAPGVDPTFPPELIDWSCGAGFAESTHPTISADGRYVAFDSNATDLVPGDTNGARDVFLKDVQTGSVERLSVRADGSQPNTDQWGFGGPIMTPDARYVLFGGVKNDIVPSQPSTFSQGMYLLDRQLHTVETIVYSPNSQNDNKTANGASISDDGRYVVFTSQGDLTPNDQEQQQLQQYTLPNGTVISELRPVLSDVFLKDRQTGTITLLSDGLGGSWVNGWNGEITGDGSTVLFESFQYDAAGSVVDHGLFSKDLATGSVERLDVDNAGNPGANPYRSQNNELTSGAQDASADGRYVSFAGDFCNLGVTCSPTSGFTTQIYLRDRVAHTTSVVSLDGNGQPMTASARVAPLSTNGRYLMLSTTSSAFETSVGAAVCRASEVFVRDLFTGTTQRVDTPPGGGCGTDERYGEGGSWLGSAAQEAITPDGRSVVFTSESNNLVPWDHDAAFDVFVNRRW